MFRAATMLFVVATTAVRAQSSLEQSAYIKDADGLTTEMGYGGSFAFDYPTVAWSGRDRTLVHVVRDRDGDGDFKTGIVDRQVIQGVSSASLSFALQRDVLIVGDPGLDGARGAENCGGIAVFEWNAASAAFEAIAHLATLDKSKGALEFSPGLGQSVAIDGKTIVATTNVSGELIVFRTAGGWHDIDSGFKGKKTSVLAENSLEDPDCVGCGRFVIDRDVTNPRDPWSFGGGHSVLMSHAFQVHEASDTIAVGDTGEHVDGSSGSVYVIRDGEIGPTERWTRTRPSSGSRPARACSGAASSSPSSRAESSGSSSAHLSKGVPPTCSIRWGGASTSPPGPSSPLRPAAGGTFGWSVAFDHADRVFVAAIAASEDGGAVYEYENVAGSWSGVGRITGANTENSPETDRFGRHVAFSQGMLLAAATHEDDADTAAITTGPAGPASDADDAPDEGALYHFR